MTPSQAAGGSKGTRPRTREDPLCASEHHNVSQLLMIKYFQDEINSMRAENQSLHDDVKMLEQDVKTLMNNKEVQHYTGPNPSSDDGVLPAVMESTAARSTKEKKNKAKKKKRKKKRDSNEVANCLTNFTTRASTGKVILGLISIALLASMTLGQGIIGGHDSQDQARQSIDGGTSASTLIKQEELQTHIHKKLKKILDMGDEELPSGISVSLRKKLKKILDSSMMGDVEVPPGRIVSIVRDHGGRGITGDETYGSLQKQKSRKSSFHEKQMKMVDSAMMRDEEMSSSRTLQEKENNPPLYHLDLANGFCKNDPSNQLELNNGATLYQTIEECCEAEFSGEGSVALQSLCVINSPTQDASNIFSSTTPYPSTAPNLPMASNGSSIFAPEKNDAASNGPTESATVPTYSSGYTCDANPETCGCPNLNQADYRGSISTTSSGKTCLDWDAIDSSIYTDAGLEGNFCRNPTPTGDERAWCYTADDLGWELCDVPMCDAAPTASPTTPVPTSSAWPTVSPSTSNMPTSSTSPTRLCQAANKKTCGCEVVRQSDYRGTHSTTKDGHECVRWDAEWVSAFSISLFGSDYTEVFPMAEENFCRNPEGSPEGLRCFTSDSQFNLDENDWPIPESCDIPKCDRCSCIPACGTPNEENCGCPSALQAEECCEEDDSSCKCGYLKEACLTSLENNSTDFCGDAELECCKGKSDPNCKCKTYEKICSESANRFTCEYAASSCCETDDYKEHCRCDFFTYTENVLGYESESKSGHCSAALQVTSSAIENVALLLSYYLSGGDYWYNNTGWLGEEHYCEWFGITCNDDDFVSIVDLRNNNLTGKLDDLPFLELLPGLTALDLAENKLSGTIRSDVMSNIRRLSTIDLAENGLSGHADILFAPATLYVNYSHNNFTSLGFKRFNPSYATLQVIDMSNNIIEQDISEIFLNIPTNIKDLILSNNAMRGALPNPFPVFESLNRLAIDGNKLDGTLPDLSECTPRVKELDLSNQTQTDEGGLTGTIPASLSKLVDLFSLDLSGNKLIENIPTAIGNLFDLKVLNLSSNLLSRSIPSELGKLKDVLEILDLSHNMIKGRIPSELGNLDGVVIHLSGNENISNPAPLIMCFLPEFDLVDDEKLCPVERNALKDFYDSAKGLEWTVDVNWVDPYVSHCEWHGVTCNDSNNTTQLELQDNGLSGTLSNRIANLSSLEKLDLSDNDIKVSEHIENLSSPKVLDLRGVIPTEMGLLSKLIRLRLSFNSLKGEAPTEFVNLKHLELIQLHGNRLSGTIPKLNLKFPNPNHTAYVSSFVADCGNPSDLDASLECEECTMCCNAQEDCYPQEDTRIQELGYNGYMEFTGVFFGCVIGASSALALAVFTYDKYNNRVLPSNSSRRRSLALTEKDKKYALGTLGDGSVYQFFLGTSLQGWFIVLATIAAQLYMLFVFVEGSEIDLSDDAKDLVYFWKCARDAVTCKNTSDLDWQGWLAFAILMIANLMKDAINGVKMLVLSAKERHGNATRARMFFGGALITAITLFTLYVSTIYNSAIATSNTEIISNAVIILFIMDVDELFYEILMVVSPTWVGIVARKEGLVESDVESCRNEKNDEDDGLVEGPSQGTHQNLEMENMSGGDQNLQGKVESLEKVVQDLSKNMKTLLEQNEELKRSLSTAFGTTWTHSWDWAAPFCADHHSAKEVPKQTNRIFRL